MIEAIRTIGRPRCMPLLRSHSLPPDCPFQKKKKAYAKVAKPYPNNRSKAPQNSSGHASTELKQSHPWLHEITTGLD